MRIEDILPQGTSGAESPGGLVPSPLEGEEEGGLNKGCGHVGL